MSENVYNLPENADVIAICADRRGWRRVEACDDGTLFVCPVVAWAVVDDADVIGRTVQAVVIEDGVPTADLSQGKGLILGPGQRVPWRLRKRAFSIADRGRSS